MKARETKERAVGHTKGPWDWFKHSDGSISIMGDTEGQDFHVAKMLYTGFPEAVEANARLIAAAPELLAALTDAFMQFEHNGNESDSDKAVLDWMQAAISKARGEA